MIYFIGNPKLFEDPEIRSCSVNQAIDYLSKQKELAVDTETTGLSSYSDRIVMLQMGSKKHQFVVDTRAVDIRLFKELLETRKVLGHNLKFDIKFLHKYGIKIRNIYDTMVTEMVLYCGVKGRGLGLSDLVYNYTGEYMSKSERDSFLNVGFNEFTTGQIKYGANDLTYLFKIRNAQKDRMEEYDLKRKVQLENQAIIPHALIEHMGMRLDCEGWLAEEAKAAERRTEIELELDQILIDTVPKAYSPMSLINKKSKKNGKVVSVPTLVPYQNEGLFGDVKIVRLTKVNWKSGHQVKKILKDYFNFVVLDEENKPSLRSVILRKVKDKPPIVDKLIEFSELSKLISTYGKAFIDQYLNPDGRVRTVFWLINDTGRTSSGDTKSGAPNTQNIPQSHRGFFVAPEGRKIIVIDYSQQEPRITADYCQDPKLLDFVLNGDGDSHSLVASAIFSKMLGEDIVVTKANNPFSERFNKTYRDVGKTINLGLDYGKSAYSIKDDLGVSQEEAQETIDALKEAFPLKEEFFDKKKKEFWETGYIQHDYVVCGKSFFQEDRDTVLNANYSKMLKQERSDIYKLKGTLERCCQNYPIQGSAASMTKLAMIYIQRELDARPYLDAFLINQVHDELVLEASDQHAEEAAELASKCMIRAGEYFCKTVPMVAKPVISQKWEK